jgi:hypothetical protein
MTTLVEQLFDRYGVAAVGFDVVFAESDTSSGLDVLKQLAQRGWRAAVISGRHSNSCRASIRCPFCAGARRASIVVGLLLHPGRIWRCQLW